jgi:hypothetical protein
MSRLSHCICYWIITRINYLVEFNANVCRLEVNNRVVINNPLGEKR